MRRLLLRSALILIGLLVGLLVAEGGLRISGLDPIGRVLAAPGADQWNAECFELDPELGYRYAPGECGINALGFPDREVVSGASMPRVMVLGDSISADRMFPQFLEQLLTAQRGGPVDVINTGTPGYSTRNQLGVYQRHAAALQPDLVILQFCLNDYIGTPFLFRHEGQIVRVTDRKNAMWGRSSWWFSRSALYRYFALHTDSTQRVAADLSAQFPNTESALAELHAALGERLVVVVFPLVEDQSRWPHGERLSYERILSVLQASGIQHIDLTEPFLRGGGARLQRRYGPELFADLPAAVTDWGLDSEAVDFLQQQNPQLMKVNKMQRLDVDTVHPSFLGHYIAAERIAAWLAERPQLLQP